MGRQITILPTAEQALFTPADMERFALCFQHLEFNQDTESLTILLPVPADVLVEEIEPDLDLVVVCPRRKPTEPPPIPGVRERLGLFAVTMVIVLVVAIHLLTHLFR